MRPTTRSPRLDVAATALVHAVPLVLVLAGHFATIDVLLVYAIESIVGLAFVAIRLARRARTLPRRELLAAAAAGLFALIVIGGLFLEWGSSIRWLVEHTTWTTDRVLVAVLTGLLLAGHAWWALRTGGDSLGAGRQIWHMVILIVAITTGLSATEYYEELAAMGWPHSPWMDGGRHVLGAGVGRIVDTTGIDPAAFAALFVTGLMLFNETLLAVLKHLLRPGATAP